MSIAAAAAVGLTAMASTTFAPTARADDFTDVIAAVNGDFTAGQAEFATAFSDFGSGADGAGVAALLDGADDYTLSAPLNFIQGSIAVLEGDPVMGSIPNEVPDPTNLTEAFTAIQGLFAELPQELVQFQDVLALGDISQDVFYAIALPEGLAIAPIELLLIGAVGGL